MFFQVPGGAKINVYTHTHHLRIEVDGTGTGLGKGGGERLGRREKRKEMLGGATGGGNPQVETRTAVTVVRMRERILGGLKEE